ncbi:HNH endonuclease [Paenibacillus sp. FSL H3-0333]|uniref:HNH endonuclease n=1 Tax=Paenibacillus sp. FSL H3-0333 TaxID=2921373 RepID=UPI0030F8D7D9
MQTQATVSKEKDKASGGHKPYSNPQVFIRPAAAKQPDPVEIIRRVRQNPASLSREDKLALQRTLGNRAVVQLLSSLKEDGKKKEQADHGTQAAGPSKSAAAEAQMEEHTDSPEAVQAEAEQASAPAEAKMQSKEEPEGQAASAAASVTQTKPASGGSSSGPVAVKKTPAPARAKGRAEAAAEGQAEAAEREDDARSAEEAGEEPSAEPLNPGKAEESAAAQGEEAPEPAKKSAASKGADAPKKAAKEPSLGAALGALAGDGKEKPAKGKTVKISGEDPGQILDQLTQVQPTELGDAYAQAVNVSSGAFTKQTQKTKQGLPAVPVPTGLKGKPLQARKKPAALKHTVKEGFKSERTGAAVSAGKLDKMNISSSGSGGNPEAMLSEIRSAAAQPPGISMTGEADPSQLEGFHQEASQQVSTAKQAEMGQIKQPFGENEIYPEPDGTVVKAAAGLKGGQAPGAKKLPALALPADMTAGLNRSLAPEMKKQLGTKQAEYKKEQAKFDSKVLSSKADSQAQIRQAETEAKNKQISQQTGAKAEVTQLQGEWKKELDAAETDYTKQAGSAAQQKKQEINSVRTDKEREAQKKQSEAEREATQAYSKAKKEADGKHEQEKAKEEKKGGFLGWVKDKLEAVVEVVKKAVNFIFEGLRKAVKFIFDKAKQAVLGIIELGRKLITTLIKGLGVLLKKLVSVVFAKFPGIAAKICSKIDGVVNKAIKAVNQLAQKLKTKVTQVMDFLAAKVDQALAAVQNFYSKLISTLGNLLIATFLDVLVRIGALGKAAKRSFSHLEGKMWEYLLGVDISKPMGAGAAEGGAAEQAEGAGPAADEKLTAEDIEMESVEQGEMDPALIQEANLKDGETKEMSGSRDPATMDSIMAEFDTGAAKQSLGGKIADGAKLRAGNAKMLFDQIKSFVIKWMKAHGLQLLAGIAGVLVVVGAAFAISGGAITVLIPPIINIITVAMQAQAIVSIAQALAQAAGYIGTYLSQGWQKMIEPAAIALATALAMGLVELAMAGGFKAVGANLKKAGQAVKKGVGAAASGVKNVVGAGAKGIKSLLKSGAKLASRSGSMIIRNGKVVIKSLQKGLMKGAKNLRGLLDRILQKFKFKKFKLVRKGKHIRLYGEVNPWVLLIDGTMQDIEEQDFNQKFLKLKQEGKKPVKLSDAEYSKLSKLEDTELKKISMNADGDKDKIDFDSFEDPSDVINQRAKKAGLDLSPKSSPYKQLGYRTKKKFNKKVDNRTITKEEWKRLQWNKRLDSRRDEGVQKFWDQERARIRNGEQTTREWSQEQINDILNDKAPTFNGKTITGHHAYSVSKNPHLADKGEIIYPATFKEHLKRWHGNSYRKSLPGKPMNPQFPEEF